MSLCCAHIFFLVSSFSLTVCLRLKSLFTVIACVVTQHEGKHQSQGEDVDRSVNAEPTVSQALTIESGEEFRRQKGSCATAVTRRFHKVVDFGESLFCRVVSLLSKGDQLRECRSVWDVCKVEPGLNVGEIIIIRGLNFFPD